MENTRRRYIITGEAWYAATATERWDRQVRAEMSIGLDSLTDDGHYDGCIGEWIVTWEEIARGHIATRIKVFHDGWESLVESGFPEIMTELGVSGANDPAPTMEQMVEALRKRGWKDTTARLRPAGY